MKYSFAILMLAMYCVPSGAKAEEVGRTKFELPGAEWKLLTAFETKQLFAGGATAGSSEPIQNKVFYLAGADSTVKALLAIASADARQGLVAWSGVDCPSSKAGLFADDFGSNRHGRTSECLIVAHRFTPAAYYKPDGEIGRALKEKGLKLRKSGRFVFANYGTQSGAILRAELLTQGDFAGLPGAKVSAAQLFDVPPGLIAWGESLQTAVKNSANSLRGDLTIPSIEFK